jgi:hypothetical protein
MVHRYNDLYGESIVELVRSTFPCSLNFDFSLITKVCDTVSRSFCRDMPESNSTGSFAAIESVYLLQLQRSLSN